MTKKCLIVSGSPNNIGQTAFIIDYICKNFNGEVEVLNTFAKNGGKGVSSCIDCGGCLKREFCIVQDEFCKLYKDDYEVLIVVSPIYQSNLPGPMINLINRFNFLYNNRIGLGIKHSFCQKQGTIILTGGGDPCKKLQGESNEDLPLRQANYILKRMNAEIEDDNILLCLNTNDISVKDNIEFLNQIKNLIDKLNK